MSIFKPYSERSKARRALLQVYKVSAETADSFLHKVDGKHGFYLNYAGIPCEAPTAPGVTDLIEQDSVQEAQHIDTQRTSDYTPRQEDAQFASTLLAALSVPVGHEPEPETPAVPESETAPPASDAFSMFAFSQLTASSNSAPASAEAAKPVRSASTKGQKIEKDRPVQNGVQLPSSGTLCRAVWDALSTMLSATGNVPTALEIKALGGNNSWNMNNVSIEYYRWRKFNGVTGRSKKNV